MTAERLDHLAPDDPLAQHSRQDLQRVHRAMRSVSILKSCVGELNLAAQPHTIVDLGGGDGTLLLRLAGALRPTWTGVDVTLLDRQDLLSASVRESFERLDWRVSTLQVDALEWARSSSPAQFDLCVTVLFLHHFHDADLRLLLGGIARRTDALIACEPARNGTARIGSRLIKLLGANEVTCEDGVKSVAAGFADSELTQAWPGMAGEWRLNEYMQWPFSHCFVAARAGADGVTAYGQR